MKNVGIYLLVILLFFAIDRGVGALLQSSVRHSQFRYSRLYDNRAEADILLVGNSRGLALYQPYIESVTGKKTFNLSYNGMPTDLAKVLVMDYLDRYPNIKRMVVDVTIASRLNDQLISGFLPYSIQSMRLDTLIKSKNRSIWGGGKLSALFRYNNEVFQRALYYKNRSDADWLLDRVISPAMVAEVSKNKFNMDLHPYLLAELAAAVKYAQSKGVEVQLVIGPYFPGFTVTKSQEFKMEVEKLTGLPVHDYSNALTDPELFGDYQHPNVKGAKAFIDLMKGDEVF